MVSLGTLEDDVKERPYLLAVPLLLVGYIAFRHAQASPATSQTIATSNPMQQAPEIGVGQSQLANFVQQNQTSMGALAQQEQTDIVGVQQQLAQNQAQTAQSLAQAQQTWQSQMQQQVQTQTQQAQQSTSLHQGYQSARDAWTGIGENNILHFFSQFQLPGWIARYYVAQKWALPSSANDLSNWLRQMGLSDGTAFVESSDPNSQSCYAVNCAHIPAGIQAELTAAGI